MSREAEFLLKILLVLGAVFVLIVVGTATFYVVGGLSSVGYYGPPIGQVLMFAYNAATVSGEAVVAIFALVALLHQVPRIRKYLDELLGGGEGPSEKQLLAPASGGAALLGAKTSVLDALNDGYGALSGATKPEAKKAALERIRAPMHRLCFGESFVWDGDVRTNLTKYFDLLAGIIQDPQMFVGASQHLAYLFRKGDVPTLDAMRKTLREPFEKAYQALNPWNLPESLWVWSALVGLNEFGAAYVDRLIDDILIGSNPKFVSFIRSLDLDLRGDLRARSDYSKIGAYLVKKVEQYEGVNDEALARAKQLSASW